MASDVPAVVTTMRLLERIARDWPDPVSTSTLIDELNLNRSTCYNVLGTLRRSGWAATSGDRSGWWLGPKLLTLVGTRENWQADVVQAELDDLSRRLGFLAFAVRRTAPDGYAVVAKADPRQGVRITVGVGDTFPFSAPAIMRAFHAWSEPEVVEQVVARHDLERFTPETGVDWAGLWRELAATRRRGYGVSVREYDLGQSGVSAPVFDEHGEVTLVLCSLAFASELDESSAPFAGELIRDAGLRLTERIGGVVPSTGSASPADDVVHDESDQRR